MSGTGTRTLLACLLLAVAGCSSGDGSEPTATESEAASVSAEPSEPAAVEPPGCDELADEAVKSSRGKDVELLKVRGPRIVKDNRDTVELPSGNGEALVLRCRGLGVWSNDSTHAVRFELVVDRDKDAFVTYEAIN